MKSILVRWVEAGWKKAVVGYIPSFLPYVLGEWRIVFTFKYFCGQSYKHFMLVNYDSRVVIWGIFQSGTTLES